MLCETDLVVWFVICPACNRKECAYCCPVFKGAHLGWLICLSLLIFCLVLSVTENGNPPPSLLTYIYFSFISAKILLYAVLCSLLRYVYLYIPS